MLERVKVFAHIFLCFVCSGGIIFICLLMNQGLSEFSKAQQMQTQVITESRDLVKNATQRYERVITFGLAKLAAQSYKAEEEATALMDQAIQDEADFGDEKLAKIMNLFSRF